MPHDDEVFIPEQVDEQIEYLWDALHFVQPGQRGAPEMELIENLQRHYQQMKTDARSLDTVWERLAEQGVVSEPSPRQRTRPPQGHQFPPERPRPSIVPAPAARRRRRLPQLIVAIAAVFLLTTVVGGLVVGLVLVRQHGAVVSSQPTTRSTTQPGQTPPSTVQPTAQPGQTPQITPLPALAPPVVTYIGGDGNLWEMSISQGTKKQVTTDAAQAIQYSGLGWSPDGSTLAMLRTASVKSTQSTTYTLVLLAANGAAPRFVTLAGFPDNQPFVWSSDSRLVAYREITGQYLSSGDQKDTLHIIDAQSGREVKSVAFDRGPTGCGGGGFGDLTVAIWEAHHTSYAGIDTFAWAPDQQTMLVAYTCANAVAEQIDLSNGATKSLIYPRDASYQPNGNLILGLWRDGTLGLVDFSDNHVRALAQQPPSGSPYALYLGWSSWSADGQTIYYEYEDSIWSIGVDRSNAHQVVAGTPLDSQQVATVLLVPSLSPDGTLLLYLQAHGSNAGADSGNGSTIPETNQWMVAHADGSNPMALPQGTTEAVWQPGK